MIRRILEALEAEPRKEVLRGVEPGGSVAWRRSATEVLGEIGGWQEGLRQRGVRRGDRVAIDLPRGPALLPAHLAVLASGACVVPVNASLSAAERERVLARADLAALVGPADGPPGAAPLRLAEPAPAEPALLVFTSGTTGEPKGVPLSMANLEANLAGLTDTWGLRREDRLLHVLPAHHVHGLVLGLYGSARLGMAVVLHPRFDAERCLASLDADEITVFMGVPTMYHRLVRCSHVPDLSRMRVFISGSAPLSPRDFGDFAKRFGHTPLERYGLTETMIVASNPLDGERRPGSVGLPLPLTTVRLAADGEIEVQSPSVMSGYWRSPGLDDASTMDGFFRTGDLGRHDEAGYLCITGRKKDVIIVGGSNVVPGEVEQALADDPGIDDLAAGGLPDADRGEIVAAFVVPRRGEDEAALERRLRARADERLAPYKRPRVYRFLAVLPRNSMGKIDRGALR